MPTVTGKCRICGSEGPLSFEHVPPKSAFNESPAFLQTMDEWMDSGKKRRGRVQQRGFGGFTLCERCNNNTGAWYGSEYVKWARELGRFVLEKPEGASIAKLWLNDVFPLRFLKQAVTCLFSANQPVFGESNPELVSFVLDRDRKGLSPKYEVYLTLVAGSLRSVGVSAKADVRQRDLNVSRMQVLTEFAHMPFAVRMTLKADFVDPLGRISHFAQYGFDEKCGIRIALPVGDIASPFPGDYRSEAQVKRDIASGNFP
jgi:hypothetical protein